MFSFKRKKKDIFMYNIYTFKNYVKQVFIAWLTVSYWQFAWNCISILIFRICYKNLLSYFPGSIKHCFTMYLRYTVIISSAHCTFKWNKKALQYFHNCQNNTETYFIDCKMSMDPSFDCKQYRIFFFRFDIAKCAILLRLECAV